MSSYRLGLVVWIVFLLGMTPGCGDQNSAQRPTEVSQEVQPELSPDDEIRPITVEQWMEWGLPSPDEVWRAEQLAEAVAAIENMSRDDRRYLPRLDDESSAPIFRRLVAEENLQWYRDQRVDVEMQFQTLTNSIAVLSQAALCYRPTESESQDYELELVAISGAILHFYAEVTPKIDSVTALRLDRYPGRREQVIESDARMRALSCDYCWSTINLLKPEGTSSVDAKRQIARHLEVSLPRIYPHIAQDIQMLILIELCEIDQEPAHAEIQPELSNLLAAVERASGSNVRAKLRAMTQKDSAIPLTAEQWRELGVPSTDRPWSSSELTAFTVLLAIVRHERPGLLPSLRDPIGAEIFDRMTELRSLSQGVDAAETLRDRFDEVAIRCLDYLQLSLIYIGPTDDWEFYGKEILRLNIAGIQSEIAREQLLTQHGPFPKHFPGTNIPQQDAQHSPIDFMPLLRTRLMYLKKKEVPLDSRRQFAEILCESIRAIWNMLDEEDQESLVMAVFQLKKDCKCPELEIEIFELVVAVVELSDMDETETPPLEIQLPSRSPEPLP